MLFSWEWHSKKKNNNNRSFKRALNMLRRIDWWSEINSQTTGRTNEAPVAHFLVENLFVSFAVLTLNSCFCCVVKIGLHWITTLKWDHVVPSVSHMHFYLYSAETLWTRLFSLTVSCSTVATLAMFDSAPHSFLIQKQAKVVCGAETFGTWRFVARIHSSTYRSKRPHHQGRRI